MNSNYEMFWKRDGLTKYKPIILFVLKALAVLTGFFLLKNIHHLLIDPSSGWLFLPALKELNIYLLFSNTISYPCTFLLNSLGYETHIFGRIVAILGFSSVDIQAPCMGFDIFATFTALIIAYPSKAPGKKKMLFMVAGILMIHLLNILRVTALLIIIRYSYEVTNHHDVFNLVVYSFVLLLFYLWIKYGSKPSVRLQKQTFKLP